jgi:hypothetical protein
MPRKSKIPFLTDQEMASWPTYLKEFAEVMMKKSIPTGGVKERKPS